MKKFYKQVVAIIVMVTFTITYFAIPAAAIDSEGIVANRFTSVYDIDVDGITYNVVITSNLDGTDNILVEGNGTTLSWTTKVIEDELEPLANIESASYESYRYTFFETAAVPWHLYRPLQDDGSAATKGIGYADSEFARRFADQIININNAEELISQFFVIQEIISKPIPHMLLKVLGDVALYKAGIPERPLIIAGAVADLMASYGVPTNLESALEALIKAQYSNICDYVAAADNYFELA